MSGANDFPYWLPVCGFLLGTACLVFALSDGKRKRLVDNLPTSKTTGVFIGLVELKGTAESERPLRSFLAENDCVYYSYSIEESWSRMVTETYTDSEGKSQTRTRQESGWTNVAQDSELILFYLQDDCGVILVRPEGAKLEPVTVLNETCGRSDPMYYSKGPAGAVMDSDHRRRFVERAIPLHQPLYLMGQARERQDVVAPEIARDAHAPMFLISTRSEQQVSAGLGWAFWGWVLFGFVLSAGSVIWRDSLLGLDTGRRWPIYWAAIAGFSAICGAGWVAMVYNSMVELRQRVRQAWSQVDVQLRRRHDLIPNLASVVQGCRDYEKDTQTELAALRAELNATPPGAPGPDFRAVSGLLTAVAERYPELKANQTFAELQKNLIDTEQRIALARGYFNDIATHYNTRLQILPDCYIAALGMMKPQALMEANAFERAAVQVKLAGA